MSETPTIATAHIGGISCEYVQVATRVSLTKRPNRFMFTELSEDDGMLVAVYDLVGGSSVLSGAKTGRQLLAELIAIALPPGEPGPIYLDFNRIVVATASFLREGVIAFRDHTRASSPMLYPVVANASAGVAEELEFFLRQRKDAFWTCNISATGEPRDARILGGLDDAHRTTFDLVMQLGRASAPSLAAQSHEHVAPTAWNNRLSNLAARGLLIERRSGKTKTFAPVLGGA